MCVDTKLLDRLNSRAPQFDTLRDAYVWVKIHFLLIDYYVDGTDVVAQIAESLYRLQNSEGV